MQSGELSLLLNPLNNRLKADIVLKTLASTEAPLSPEEIISPGEYEIRGIEIRGWQVNGESTGKFIKTVYTADWESMRFVFLGHISGLLPPDVLEELVEADVVFIPTGDSHFISAPEAVKLLKQISPKVIIPAYYKNANDLTKALGLKPENAEKLVFRKKDIAEDKMRLVILKADG